LSFFVGDVTTEVGLGFFGPLYLALSHNRKRKLCASFFKKNKAKIRNIGALDWPSSVCGWKVMSYTQKNTK